MRGKAARNDTYSTYEPWENPGVYGGIIWFNSKDHDYRLSRNFQKDHVLAELLNEDTKELADIDEVGLEKIFGNISEAIYDNTVSVAQLKSVTGQDLVRETSELYGKLSGSGRQLHRSWTCHADAENVKKRLPGTGRPEAEGNRNRTAEASGKDGLCDK